MAPIIVAHRESPSAPRTDALPPKMHTGKFCVQYLEHRLGLLGVAMLATTKASCICGWLHGAGQDMGRIIITAMLVLLEPQVLLADPQGVWRRGSGPLRAGCTHLVVAE
eukprot:1319176-Alexandrium_andersonii.AAC.1